MDDPLDNELKSRIREVFENYQDTSADEGWLLLREKFPAKAKRRPVAWLWWGSAAAILLVFLGTGLWLADKQAIGNNPVVKVKKTQPNSNLYTKTDQHKNNTLTDSAILHKQEQAFADSRIALGPNFKSYLAKVGLPRPKPFVINQKFVNADIEPDSSDPGNVAVIGTGVLAGEPVKSNGIVNKVNAGKSDIYAGMPIIKDTPKQSSTSPATNSQPKTSPQPVINDLFANDNNIQENRKNEKQKSTDKIVRFSVYAATYFNYAKGSNNRMNIGAGFTSDIKLTHNLRLSTGASIAQNTLNYASQIPLSTSTSNTIAATASIAATAYKAQGQLLETSPALKNYNANLVGLDIPLNLKYLFNPEKNDTYVSAGLSSGTFINETYTYNYSYPTPTNSDTEPTKDVASKNSFNGFYFGKTLNFAFGLGYPLGKTNRLIIEPFLKYPLDGLGSQQLRFGAGGVNLKFNFKGTKK